jgi:predicted amidohydrolase YtcJ
MTSMTTPNGGLEGSGPGLLLREARLVGGDAGGGPCDVVVAGGRVGALLPAGSARPAGLPAVVEEVPLGGRWLMPGLWDGHVHFTQWVVRRQRLDLSGTRSAAEVLDRVAGALRERPAGSRAIVGYGFRDGLWPEPSSLAALDAVAPDRPVVLAGGDLHSGWVNSRAAAWLGVVPDASGLLREAAWMAVLDRLDRDDRPDLAAYRDAAVAAARRGVVGVVEFENADNADAWPVRTAAGVTALRIEASVWPDRLEAAIAAGRRTGDGLDGTGLVTFGRLKVIVDGSLNTRTAWCHDPYPGLAPSAPHACGICVVPPERLLDLLATADRHGIRPAVHAIGDRANQEVIDAFERLRIPGVIEHAQLLAEADFARLARLGLVASVQPEHAMDDRDVADRYWAGRTERAFAYRSLHDAGATLQLGSDAPVAPLDPWLAIAAATHRSRDGREPWHPEQRLPLDVALAASARGRTRVAVGDVADLAVLDDDPAAVGSDRLRDMRVAATMLDGRWTWNDL